MSYSFWALALFFLTSSGVPSSCLLVVGAAHPEGERGEQNVGGQSLVRLLHGPLQAEFSEFDAAVAEEVLDHSQRLLIVRFLGGDGICEAGQQVSDQHQGLVFLVEGGFAVGVGEVEWRFVPGCGRPAGGPRRGRQMSGVKHPVSNSLFRR